jgi:hypothetical protein
MPVYPEVMKGGHVFDSALSRVEAGSNTSTVALRVVGGDEKEPRAGGYNWATMFLGI